MGGGRISNGAEGQSQRFEISDHPDYMRHNEINCQSQFLPSSLLPTSDGCASLRERRERERRSARGPTPETETGEPPP